MKSFIVFALFVTVATAASLQDPKDALTLRNDNDNVGFGPYKYAYETSDGKSAYEQGEVQNIGADNEALRVSGQFSYVGTDGLTYTVEYTADENGFHPRGAHLPKVQ